MPLQTQHIGLHVTQFRNDNKMPVLVDGAGQDVVMRECNDQKTMIRSLETVQDTSVQRR